MNWIRVIKMSTLRTSDSKHNKEIEVSKTRKVFTTNVTPSYRLLQHVWCDALQTFSLFLQISTVPTPFKDLPTFAW